MPEDSTTPSVDDTTPAAPDATPGPMDPEMLEVMRHACRPSRPHGTRVYVDLVRPLIGDRDHWEAETASAKAACDALRERCEAFESAAKNLRMVVSADRGGIPCRSPGGADCPPEGWHFVFGGPYTSYTMPEPDEDGELVWWVFDEDEGVWTEAQSLGSRVVSDEDRAQATDGETIKHQSPPSELNGPAAPDGATINSNDEDVGQVAAALADATLAGGLSTAYHREADDALRRLWHRAHRAEKALCMHLDCTAEELELGFEIGDPT